MCVWSAYTGKKGAAAPLWESLEKIEGIWGGYYTGLVTEWEGKFHMGKVLGNTRIWKESFSLSDFPGTAGLIHSRTNSGGDERWGHPFIGSSGKVALVSQGCGGIFKERTSPLFEVLGNEMAAKGKTFSSGIYDLPKRYPVLSDGGQVHNAEVAVQAVEYYYEKFGDPLKAIKEVFSELNNESATLFLFADRPGVIGFVNSNQHIVYQKKEDGVFLSITALGLPGNMGVELPCNSVGLITPETISLESLHPRYETLMELPPGTVKAVYEYIVQNPGKGLANACDAVIAPLFPAGSLNTRVGLSYRALEILVTEGMVRMEKVEEESSMGTAGMTFKLYAVEG